jgi:hypothetical protein
MPEADTPQIQILAFRAAPELVEKVLAVARDEGISKSDVCRRAVLRDLKPSDTGAA